MHKYLKQNMLCPNCKNDLTWDITHEDDTHIINASIICSTCGKKYFVKDRIANFLLNTENDDDNWQKNDDFLEGYFKTYPELKDKLLNTPIEQLNAADLYARAELLKIQGDSAESEKINKLAKSKLSFFETEERELKNIVNNFKNKNGFVVDMASGLGRLVEALLKNTSLDIISTDISYSILCKDQSNMDVSYINRISYIAFDMKAIPFKDKSIDYITTNFGLQNIQNDHQQVTSELYRICSNIFYATCGFYFETDTVHVNALEKMGMDNFWFKNRLISEFQKVGWNIQCENSTISKSYPTSTGEIVKGYDIDTFPIAETDCENCTMIFTV